MPLHAFGPQSLRCPRNGQRITKPQLLVRSLGVRRSLRFCALKTAFRARAGRPGLGCQCGAPCAARSSPQARIPACFKPFRRRLRACGWPARAFSFPVSAVRPGLRAASRFGLARTAAFLAWRARQSGPVRAFSPCLRCFLQRCLRVGADARGEKRMFPTHTPAFAPVCSLLVALACAFTS